MSFSSEVKNELSRLVPRKKCCMLAELSGFLRVTGSLRLAGGGKFKIVASTENAAIARHYKKLIKEYFDSNAGLEIGESMMPGKARAHGYRYSLTINPDEKSSQILRETGMMLIKEGNDYFSDGIYPPIVSKKCDKRAYIRGIFLGCGTISEPRSGCHMEFIVKHEQLANDLRKLINSFEDMSANQTKRKNDCIVYLKKADYISDLMSIMGADDSVLEFEEVRINMGIRRDTQRILNCDSANMDRTLTASEEQLEWIKAIKDAGQFSNLPDPLQAVALIREERPEASLTEIGEALEPPIKKPGVSKRFAKLKEFAAMIEIEEN